MTKIQSMLLKNLSFNEIRKVCSLYDKKECRIKLPLKLKNKLLNLLNLKLSNEKNDSKLVYSFINKFIIRSKNYFSPSYLYKGYVLGNLEKRGEGASGSYYKISQSKGLKILIDTNKYYDTVKQLKRSQDWKDAKKEFLTQKLVARSGIALKVFKLTYVYSFQYNSFFPAIEMEHFNHSREDNLKLDKYVSETLVNLGKTKVKVSSIYDVISHIEKSLRQNGLVHGDLHRGNVLVKKNNIKLIDFGIVHKI